MPFFFIGIKVRPALPRAGSSEGALPLAFCQMSRTPARIARMPMPRHAGEGVSAAVEMPSRVLSPMVKAVERMRATTQGRTPERKASTPAYLSRSWMRAAMSRMMKKGGQQEDTDHSGDDGAPGQHDADGSDQVNGGDEGHAQRGAERPQHPALRRTDEGGHVDGQRAGCGLRHRDEAQKLGLREPAVEQDFLPDEGDHAVAAAEGDGTDLQKGEE